jgi:hypothetical protein
MLLALQQMPQGMAVQASHSQIVDMSLPDWRL